MFEKSCIRETKNLSTDADSKTVTITFFHQEIAGLQVMDVLFEETDCLCYTFFHQEIAADGRAL